MTAGIDAGTAYVTLQGDFRRLDRQLAAKFTGPQWAKAGAAAGGAIAAGATVALFEVGRQFDDVRDTIRTGTGETGKALRALNDDFKAVVEDVPAQFGDASQAITQLHQRLDLTGRPLQRMSKQFLELSRITDSDLNTNIETSTRVFGDWSIQVEKQPAALDKLFRAQQATGASLDGLGQMLVKYGAPLRQMGFDFEESAALMAKFEKEGVNTQLVLGSLRIALGKMAREGVEDPAKALDVLIDRIEKAGSTGEANALALETFGARAGPDMAAAIREGRFEVDDLIRTIESGDDTIRKAGRSTEDFDEQWQRFKNRTMVQLEPVANRVFGTLSKEAGKFFDVLTDPKLSRDEKISKVLDRLSDVASEVFPEIAENAAQAAPEVAEAFVRGFAEADSWGKLAVGTFLLSKFGGKNAFKAFGVTAGTSMGAGIAAGAAGGAAGAGAAGGVAGGIVSKLKGPAARAGLIGVGLVWADQLLESIADRMESDDIWEALEKHADQPIHADVIEGIFGKTDQTRAAESLLDTFRAISDEASAIDPTQARKLREEIGYLDEASESAKDQLRAMVNEAAGRGNRIGLMRNEFGRLRTGAVKDVEEMRKTVASNLRTIERDIGKHTGEGRDAARQNFKSAAHWIERYMSDGQGATKKGAREMERLLDKHTADGSKALKGNMDDIIRTIARTMTRGGKITQDGLELIEQAYVSQLRMFGLSPSQALKEARPGTNKWGGPEEGSRGPGAQLGMMISEGNAKVPGFGDGDKVRLQALVEPGERVFVLNRNATKELEQLQGLNAAVPRFQEGGIVELLHPFNDPAGHGGSNSHLHIAASTKARIIQIGKWLQSLGWLVGENPAFGGIQGGHAPGGYHPRGLAIDVNWPVAGAEAAKIRAILPLLESGEIGAVEKLKRILVEGEDSPLKTVIQAALDTAVGGAQAKLEDLAPIEGAEAGLATGSGADLMKKIAAERGWNFADWWELDRRETGHGRDLLNEDSGAFNRAQFMPGITEGQYGPGSRHGATMEQQIYSMAAYIAERYGNPSAALAFHNSHNWYQRGGLLGLAAGGGLFGDPKTVADRMNVALGDIGLGKNPKLRKAALKKFLSKIGGLGLPPKMAKSIADLTEDAARFEEFANRAEILNVEDDETGRITFGEVQGKTQLDWLHDELDALFSLRNQLVRAEPIAVARREQTTQLIEQGREKLERLTSASRRAAGDRKIVVKTRDDLREALEKELDKPKKKRNEKKVAEYRKAIKDLNGVIRGIDDEQGPRSREREALSEKILPALTTKRSDLNDLRGDLLSSLQDVQGFGPMDPMKRLPPLGTLGGDIFDVQKALADLTGKDITSIDSRQPDADLPGASPEDVAAGDTDAREAERIALLEELLRTSQLREQVALAQYDVLQNFPPYGGSFADGGIVPGPLGVPRTVIAHGGETITPPEAAGPPNVIVQFADGME